MPSLIHVLTIFLFRLNSIYLPCRVIRYPQVFINKPVVVSHLKIYRSFHYQISIRFLTKFKLSLEKFLYKSPARWTISFIVIASKRKPEQKSFNFRHFKNVHTIYMYKIAVKLTYLINLINMNGSILRELSCVATLWVRGGHAVTYWNFSCISFAGKRL